MPAEDGTDHANEKDHQLRQELPRGREGEHELTPSPAARGGRCGAPGPGRRRGARGRALTTGPASATSAAASRRTSGGSAPRRPRRQPRQRGASGRSALSGVAAAAGSMLAPALVRGRRRWAGGGPAPPRGPPHLRTRPGVEMGVGQAGRPGRPPPTVAVRRPLGAGGGAPPGEWEAAGGGCSATDDCRSLRVKSAQAGVGEGEFVIPPSAPPGTLLPFQVTNPSASGYGCVKVLPRGCALGPGDKPPYPPIPHPRGSYLTKKGRHSGKCLEGYGVSVPDPMRRVCMNFLTKSRERGCCWGPTFREGLYLGPCQRILQGEKEHGGWKCLMKVALGAFYWW